MSEENNTRSLETVLPHLQLIAKEENRKLLIEAITIKKQFQTGWHRPRPIETVKRLEEIYQKISGINSPNRRRV